MTQSRSNWDTSHGQALPTPRIVEAPAELSWARYHGGERCPAGGLSAAVAAAKHGEGYLWIGLHNPSQRTMSNLGHQLGLHELAIEDADLRRENG